MQRTYGMPPATPGAFGGPPMELPPRAPSGPPPSGPPPPLTLPRGFDVDEDSEASGFGGGRFGRGMRPATARAPALGAQLFSRFSTPVSKSRRIMAGSDGSSTMASSQVSGTMQRHKSEKLDELLDRINAKGLRLGVELSFRRLSFSITTVNTSKRRVRRTILHPVSGVIRPGSLVAVMGPSGSGKSTLLDIIADKKTMAYGGSVFVNGHKRTRALFRRISSYMPQYDFGSGLETVYESVKFVAMLKSGVLDEVLADGAGASEDPIRVLLGELGLTRVSNSLIGNELVRGISGGQARRAALARAIVSFPSLVFADEPTSGLSSTDSEVIVQVLSRICSRLQMTCVASIHQPRQSIFKMFDHLILLAEGGQCVFNGPASAANAYFAGLGFPVPAQVTAPDWFMDTISRSGKVFRAAYRKGRAEADHEAARVAGRQKGKSEEMILRQFSRRGVSAFKLSVCAQIGVVTGRALRQMRRDANTLTVVTMHKVFLGVFLGLVYFNINNADPVNITYQITFLFSLMLAVAASAMQSIGELVEDRYTMQMEKAEGLYSAMPYMVARTTKSVIVAAVGNSILVMTSYFLAGFSGTNGLFILLLAFVLFLAVDSIISFVVAISDGAQTATSYSVLSLSVLGIFNGFTANTVSSPDFVNWISFISPYYWTFCGGINVMFKDFNYTTTPQYPDYQSLLDSFGYPADYQVNVLLINLGLALYFRVLQYFALRFVTTLKI